MEQRQPRPATTVKPDDGPGERSNMTNAERMMCAKACLAKVGTYLGKMRSMAAQVDQKGAEWPVGVQ